MNAKLFLLFTFINISLALSQKIDTVFIYDTIYVQDTIWVNRTIDTIEPLKIKDLSNLLEDFQKNTATFSENGIKKVNTMKKIADMKKITFLGLLGLAFQTGFGQKKSDTNHTYWDSLYNKKIHLSVTGLPYSFSIYNGQNTTDFNKGKQLLFSDYDLIAHYNINKKNTVSLGIGLRTSSLSNNYKFNSEKLNFISSKSNIAITENDYVYRNMFNSVCIPFTYHRNLFLKNISISPFIGICYQYFFPEESFEEKVTFNDDTHFIFNLEVIKSTFVNPKIGIDISPKINIPTRQGSIMPNNNLTFRIEYTFSKANSTNYYYSNLTIDNNLISGDEKILFSEFKAKGSLKLEMRINFANGLNRLRKGKKQLN